MQSEGIATFTSSERDYIRRQLDRFFSTLPTVADGFQLKTWRGGRRAGKPKLPPTAKGLVERSLMPGSVIPKRTPATAVLHRDRPRL